MPCTVHDNAVEDAVVDDPAPTSARVQVAIVDDHRIFAEALAALLAREEDMEVVGLCTDAREAVGLVVERRPAIALIDYAMPHRTGAEVAADIRRQAPGTRVVMITGDQSDDALVASLLSGCAGHLRKQGSVSEVCAAIRTVARGGSVFPSDAVARVLPRLRTERPGGSDLTDRERTVLQLLANGYGNREIADQLHLSVNTVRNYVQAILGKLDAHSKLEAVATALRRGLVDVRER